MDKHERSASERRLETATWDRRSVLKSIGAGSGGIALAGCLGDEQPSDDADGDTDDDADDDADPDEPEELTELHTIEPEGSATIPGYLQGVEEGIWEDHGIDFSFEVAAFGKFSRQLVDETGDIAGISSNALINFINEGEDIVIVGIGQAGMQNPTIARADSDIEEVDDLTDAVVGHPGEGTLTWNGTSALLESEFDFDLANDAAEIVTSPPPALYSLFLEGEIDVMMNFQGQSVSALATGEGRTVFDPYEFWQDQTGQPLIVSPFATTGELLEDSPEVVHNYLLAWEDAKEMYIDNVDETIQNYGLLAGLETDEEAEFVADWIEEGKLLGPRLDDDLRDSQYEFQELIYEHTDFYDTLPDKDDLYVTWSELEQMAG